MTLNIKNPEAERLVAELAILTGNTKTGAVRQAARRELDRLRRESIGDLGGRGRLTLRLETELGGDSAV